MLLPNSESANVPIEKLRDYSLDLQHEEGKHKARVFYAALGITAADADWLQDPLLAAAKIGGCQLGRKTKHGQRYIIDFEAEHAGKVAMIRSVWNVRPGESFLGSLPVM